MMTHLRRAALVTLAVASVGAVFLPRAAVAGATPIKHVIIIVQENRTPDNLFHDIKKYLPDADIADSGLDSKGDTIRLKPIALADPFDLDHYHTAFVAQYDNGKMDGADLVPCYPYYGACPPFASYHYVREGEVEPYYRIARNYGFANRMFQSQQGPSFPSHQFVFGATSQPEADSPLFAADNVSRGNGITGCIGPPQARVMMIDPTGNENTLMFPCFDHSTLADLLDAPPHDPTHPITWRYYSNAAGSIWNAPNAIDHLCQAAQDPPVCTGTHWTNGDIVTWPPQVLVDIHKNTLHAVNWVIPTAQDSDHPFLNTGTGPAWVASIVNAVGNSPYWKDTAIFITWDEWGGWYDHVTPPLDPTYGYFQYGFRVPLLVVSAYTRPGYVSNVTHNFASIVRFVETVFDLGLIPPGNFADSRSDDLSDFFDFKKPPRAFVPIATNVPESRFLDKTRPMVAPDDD